MKIKPMLNDAMNDRLNYVGKLSKCEKAFAKEKPPRSGSDGPRAHWFEPRATAIKTVIPNPNGIHNIIVYTTIQT